MGAMISKRFDRIDSTRSAASAVAVPRACPVTTTSALAPARVVAARNAVYLVFAMNGIAFATWASRIPDVKAALGLSAGQLGLTLLCLSAGSLVGLPASGWLSSRLGGAGSVRLGLGTLLIGLIVISVGVDGLGSRWALAAGLFAVGLGVGIWDVGMNLEGANVERLLGRAIMPWFHAAFSGGTVVAALFGALMSRLDVPVAAHLIPIGVMIVVAGAWGVRDFLPRGRQIDGDAEVSPAAESPAAQGESSAGTIGVLQAWREPRTLLIGVMTFVAAFTEGTANDWLSVSFVEGYHLEPWAGVLAMAVFLSFMTLGRILGTGLLDRYGRVPVLRVAFVTAGAGSLLVVFGGSALAYLGAAIWGIGISLGFPVGMSAAADDPLRAAARISVVATIGYTAFIAGPPLLGFLGDHVGMLHALLIVGAMLVIALLTVTAAREPENVRPG